MRIKAKVEQKITSKSCLALLMLLIGGRIA